MYIKQTGDVLHGILDTSKNLLLKELILFGTLYIFYLYSDSHIITAFVKTVLIFILLRYVLSVLTNMEDQYGKRYFILNIHVIIFTSAFLLMNELGILKDYNLLTLMSILLYSILVVSTKEFYTSDVAITLIIVYALYNNNYLKNYII